MNRAELVADAKAKHGESPVWCSYRKVLYWLDINDMRVHMYDPFIGIDASYELDIMPTSLIKKRNGGFAVSSTNGIYTFNNNFTGKRFVLSLEADKDSTRFNDAKADPQGRLWAGTMHKDGKAGKGSLYRIDSRYSYKRILSTVDISNGIVWSSDNRMYYTDSLSREIHRFDYNPQTGEIRNRKVEYKFESEIPDGMAIDSNNNIWVALWGEGKVVCINTKQHSIEGTVVVDAKLTSAVAFGGEDMSTLYITTSRLGLAEADINRNPLSGGLFRFKVGVKGILFHEFIEKS